MTEASKTIAIAALFSFKEEWEEAAIGMPSGECREIAMRRAVECEAAIEEIRVL